MRSGADTVELGIGLTGRGAWARAALAVLLPCLAQLCCGCKSATLTDVVVNGQSAGPAELQKVRISRNGAVVPTERGMALLVGDDIQTDPSSVAAISFYDGSEALFGSLSRVQILNPRLRAFFGSVFVKVKGFFGVETEYVSGDATGTEFLLTVTRNDNVVLTVFTGQVRLTSRAGKWDPVLVTQLQQAVVSKASPPQTRRVPLREAGRLRQWADQARRAVGPGPQRVVPPLERLPLERAKALLKNAGLRVGRIAYRSRRGASEGTVISQDPKPNTKVPAGTSVNLVVQPVK